MDRPRAERITQAWVTPGQAERADAGKHSCYIEEAELQYKTDGRSEVERNSKSGVSDFLDVTRVNHESIFGAPSELGFNSSSAKPCQILLVRRRAKN